MMNSEEDILDALSQLLECAKAIEQTIDPFVNGGVQFSPGRSDVIEVMLNNFGRAEAAYHGALRAADQFSPHHLDE